MATITQTISPIKETVTSSERPVEAVFKYWALQRQNDPSEVLAMVNGETDAIKSITLSVRDVRPMLADIKHESHGFQIIQHDSQVLQSLPGGFNMDDFNVRSLQYAQETAAMVKKAMSARCCVVMAILCRESSPEKHKAPTTIRPLDSKANAINKPFHVAHNDFSAPGSRDTLRVILPAFFEDTKAMGVTTVHERDEFFRLKHEIIAAEDRGIAEAGALNHLDWDGANYDGPRWAQFSIWRPAEVVQRDPLAVLNPKSLFGKVSHHDLGNKPYVSRSASSHPNCPSNADFPIL
jgi:hypothetical protein